MGDFSKMLNDSRVGCYIDNVGKKPCFYANDLCSNDAVCNSSAKFT